ncbi:MAG TPA: hypothetical protein VGV09_21680 [Steroidobacteraceae bacterium]|nr:hypothetical protein [Steroidobacteraceae bacterium]
MDNLFASWRALAKERICSGVLPATVAPAEVQGLGGNNGPCALCGGQIPHGDFHYMISVRSEDKIRSWALHFLCHAAWQVEAVSAAAVLPDS